MWEAQASILHLAHLIYKYNALKYCFHISKFSSMAVLIINVRYLLLLSVQEKRLKALSWPQVYLSKFLHIFGKQECLCIGYSIHHLSGFALLLQFLENSWIFEFFFQGLRKLLENSILASTPVNFLEFKYLSICRIKKNTFLDCLFK